MRVDQQAALLEADVAGRRADQPRHRVLLHVLAHVVADELVAEMHRELLGQLGLADAGRAGEQEAAGRTIRLPEAGARALDRARDRRAPLPPARTPRARATPRGLRSRSRSDDGGLLRGNAGHARDDLLDLDGGDLDRRRSSAAGGSASSAPAACARSCAPARRASRRRRFAAARAAPARGAPWRPLRRARRWRCRAACSRAGGAPPASPPPPAHRP